MTKEVNDLGQNLKDEGETTSTALIINFLKTADLLEEVFDRFYKKFKLSKPQFNALYIIHLSGEGGITLSSLGDKMVVTRANITTLVDRMEARGLIRRVINKEDRRSIKVVITEEGKKIINAVLLRHKIFTSEILDFLTKNEKERVNELLQKIQKELINNYY